MKVVYCYIGTWIVICTHTRVTEACSDGNIGDCNQATSLPSSTTILTRRPTTVPENHRLKCRDTEAHYIGCLNGGTCLASVIDNIRFISCQCPNMYAGRRCQTIDVRIILERGEIEKVKPAYLVLGIALPCVLLIMLVSYAVYKSFRKRNSQSRFDSSDTKDAEKKSLVSIYIPDETSQSKTWPV